jgi:hypothetical protein
MDQALIDAIVKALAPIVAKVNKEPAPKNAPNAPSPDAAIGGGLGSGPDQEARNSSIGQFELSAWRAPMELRGSTIHTSAGALQVPSHGVVQTRSTDDHDDKCDCVGCGMHKELKGRGFRRMQSKKSASEVVYDDIKSVLKAGTAKSQVMDHARHLDKTGALAAQISPDLGRWLFDRAQKNSNEAPQTSWTPRDVYVEKLMQRGYSRLEAERIADGY